MAKRSYKVIKFRGFRPKAIRYLKCLGLIENGSGHRNNELMRLCQEQLGLPDVDTVLAHFRQQPYPRAADKAAKLREIVEPPPRPDPTPFLLGDDFFDTRAWRELRYRALKTHGARCQCCGATRASGKQMHVDHIKPRSRFPELQWELHNLQVLCSDCNLGKGAWDETDWREKR